MKQLICILLLFNIQYSIFNIQLKAQQIPISNQYLVNGFSLSPAYAGANDNVEAFMSFRKDWAGISGSPESRMININGALPKVLSFLPNLPDNMGIGATIMNEQTGIFRTTAASLSYSYKVKIAAIQSIRFGVSLGVLENNIDLSEISSQNQADPVVMSNQDVRSVVFDASFGVLYRIQNLSIGIALPRLLEGNVKDEAKNTLYTLKRHYLIHASYLYDINKNFQVQPFVVVRTTGNSPLSFDVSALVKYQQQMWLGLTYRNSGSIGISLGGELHNAIIANYTYEFSGEGMLGKSTGTHDISIGFRIGKTKDKAPPASPKKPYYDWIEK